MKGDSFVRNHFIAEDKKGWMISPDDVASFQISILEEVDGQKKYIRCSFNGTRKEMLDFFKHYGLSPQGRWTMWQAATKEELSKNPNAKGRNVPYNGAIDGGSD